MAWFRLPLETAKLELVVLSCLLVSWGCDVIVTSLLCRFVCGFVPCQVMDKLGWTKKKGELLLALGRHEEAEELYR